MVDERLVTVDISVIRLLYLDTNVLIAYYYDNDTDDQHEVAVEFFKTVEKNNNESDAKITLFCSHFTITEFVQSYATKPDVDDVETFKIAQELLMANKIGKEYSFVFIETQGNKKDYSFRDFFLDVQTVLLNTKPRPGIADAIHATIMKNNHLRNIVTFDEGDFKHIEGIKVVHPKTKFGIIKKM